MGDGLRSVDEHWYAVGVGYADDGAHIVDGAKGVVDVTYGHELGLWCDETLKLGEDEVAILVNGYGTQLCSLRLGYLLPGHDVGMVVEGGDDDVVALTEEFPAKGLGYEVDALSGASYEDDILL